MSTLSNSLVLPKPRSLPKIPPRAKHLFHQLIDYSKLRVGLAYVFISRALGIIQPRTLNPALLTHGLTLVLPGIESESLLTYGMCDGLADGGVPGQIRVFNWGLPFPGGYLANLTRIDRNRRRARDLAKVILQYQDEFPNRPIHLVAQSGGAGIAVFAAETLPLDRPIDGIVLLGGALSPTYNLAPALARTKKGLFNSHSTKDNVVLGLGTSIFGTTDRKFTRACGCVGFQIPSDLSPDHQKIYEEKLHQLPWTPDLADRCQHWGGHLSSGCETFLASQIAPWIKQNP